MTPLPALTPAAVRAAPPTNTACDAEAGGGGDFAAEFELARTPTKTPSAGNARAAAKAASKAAPGAEAKAETPRDDAEVSIRDGEAASTEPADAIEAAESSEPDLSALLPGWPPAALTGAQPMLTAPTSTVTVTADPTSRMVQSLADTDARVALAGATAQVVGNEAHEPAAERHDTFAAGLTAAATAAPDKPAPAPNLPAAASEPALPLQPTRNTTDAGTPPSPSPLAGTLPMPLPAVQAAPAFIAHVPAAAAPLFEARLATAVDSPAFAPALANQVSWLAGEGVQQARLSLNPVEMGPLAVTIVLDGTQARIDFSADMAGTRAAIEASLPTLAAALHDSGLTLAGGGVSDGQARHGGPDGRRAPHQGQAMSANASAATAKDHPRVPIRAARGLVDLVA